MPPPAGDNGPANDYVVGGPPRGSSTLQKVTNVYDVATLEREQATLFAATPTSYTQRVSCYLKRNEKRTKAFPRETAKPPQSPQW